MMEVELVRQRFTTTTTTTTRQVHQREKRSLWQKEKPKVVSREVVKEKTRATVQRSQRMVKLEKGNATRTRTVEKKSKYAKEITTGNLYRNVTELQNIIRQSSKERLQLERHLARATEAGQRTSCIDVTQYEALQKNNENLRQQLDDLLKTANDLQDAEIRLQKRDNEIQQLKEELDNKLLLCADLEHRLNSTLEEQGKVEKQNKDLEKLLQELEPVDEECSKLLNCCDILSSQFTLARSDFDVHENKLDNLETLVKHMREAAERRKELERQYADAVAELQRKQDEVRHLPFSRLDKHAQDTIQSLESKVRELQKKCELQNVLHEELSLEMTALRRSQAKQSWRTHRSLSADVPNETSKTDQELDLYLVGSDTIFSSNKSHYSSLPHLDNTSRGLNVSFEPFTSNPITSPGDTIFSSNKSHYSSLPQRDNTSRGLNVSFEPFTSNSITSPGDTIFSSNKSHYSSLPQRDNTSRGLNVSFEPFTSNSITSPGMNMISPGTTVSSSSPVSCSLLNSASYEIDRIIARIEQDNRVLAELERSRATVGSPVSSANLERLKAQFEEDQKQSNDVSHRSNMKSSFSSPAIDQLLIESERNKQMYWQLNKSRFPRQTSVTVKDLDVLMAKLEQDNKILAELDRKRATISSRRPYSATPPSTPMSSSLTGQVANTTQQSSHYSSTLPALPSTAPYFTNQVTKSEDAFDELDYIDLPHRGRCKVYIARYSYDPIKQSPNENPEAELQLIAGDYVLIFGEMDEDGFFSGELLDGKKGLVPSNFVEKLRGEELYEFQSQVLYSTRDSDDGSASIYPEGEVLAGDDPHLFCRGESKITTDDFHRMNDYIDLEDYDVLEEEVYDLERDQGPVPPPTRLVLERQLNKSILIGWCPPDAPRGTAEAYHVYVDGVPKATIRASEKTRALIEGVDCNQPHRISVRSVNPVGRHSRDAACTIVIGKDIPLAPSCVKAIQVTSTSAIITWLPSNSNFQHVVAINSVEVKTLKAGIFRHHISGLAPNTTYRVSVRARPARLFFNHENPKKIGLLTSAIEFKTLPKGCKGLPEPPLDIQVEPGPQDGTLLVTWLPVTINNRGTSNGAPVTGYAVYAGDRKISEIDSPTGDHALLDLTTLAPLKKRAVTVKTKSGDNLSIDSNPCVIPLELLKGVAATLMNQPEGKNEDVVVPKDVVVVPRPRRRSTGSSSSESDTELAELQKHVARRTAEFDPAASATAQTPSGQQGARVEDLVEEGLRSELSDIAEEPEEDMMQSERKERRSRENKSPREYDRRDRDRRDERHDRRDDRYDDRHHDDRRRDDRRDKMDDRRDRERRDRDDRYDDRSRRDDRYDRIDDRRDRHSRHDPKESEISRTKHSHSDSRSHERHHGHSSPSSMHRDRSQYSSRHVSDTRRLNDLDTERRNSAGQTIIEPEENLSDKEIYPSSQHVIPSIEITRDSELASHDEYLRSGHGYPDSPRYSQYYGNESSRTRAVSPTRSGRYATHNADANYYDHRGHSRPMREDYHGNNGYHGRSSRRYGMDKPRFYVAVYDYDPYTMSSNPSLANDELSFREGDIIKVYSEKNSDGYFTGEINRRMGLVPYKMVAELPEEQEERAMQLMNENMSSRHHTGDPSDPWSSLPVKKLVALYDYDPQELSPNVDAEQMELAFRTGDVIYVYGDADEDGFYMGQLNNERGLVPSNFLTEAPPDFKDPRMQSSRGSSNYPKDRQHRDSSQYVQHGSSRDHYSSSSTGKEHLPPEKGRYSERPSSDRSAYDRSVGPHHSESNRGQYNSSSHSGQHW